VNPSNPTETYKSRLWPVHCVQGTPGAELVPELDVGKVDRTIDKGQDDRVEMYSPFYDPFENPRGCDSGLAGILKDSGITDVYVVGLAADYCVKSCAVDAAKEGFTTFIVEEGTRAVDPDGWPKVRAEIETKGVKVVALEGDEVRRLMPAI
jgi:nicotinamidase-related amidase